MRGSRLERLRACFRAGFQRCRLESGSRFESTGSNCTGVCNRANGAVVSDRIGVSVNRLCRRYEEDEKDAQNADGLRDSSLPGLKQ